jgi:hypothetical protein
MQRQKLSRGLMQTGLTFKLKASPICQKQFCLLVKKFVFSIFHLSIFPSRARNLYYRSICSIEIAHSYRNRSLKSKPFLILKHVQLSQKFSAIVLGFFFFYKKLQLFTEFLLTVSDNIHMHT